MSFDAGGPLVGHDRILAFGYADCVLTGGRGWAGSEVVRGFRMQDDGL
jgi:hypothetical protein